MSMLSSNKTLLFIDNNFINHFYVLLLFYLCSYVLFTFHVRLSYVYQSTYLLTY